MPAPQDLPCQRLARRWSLSTILPTLASCISLYFSIIFPAYRANYLCFHTHSCFGPDTFKPSLCFHRHSRIVCAILNLSFLPSGRMGGGPARTCLQDKALRPECASRSVPLCAFMSLVHSMQQKGEFQDLFCVCLTFFALKNQFVLHVQKSGIVCFQ